MPTPPVVPLACPLCGESRHEVVRSFDTPPVVVGRCVGCGLLYTPLRHATPEDLLAGAPLEELRVLYRPIVEGRRRHFRARNFDAYLDIVEKAAPGRSLLDVGCAHGFLLASARSRGWSVMGIEASAPMAAFARECLTLDVRHGLAGKLDLGGAGFDAITFTDSAEYLVDPIGELTRLAAHLNPGGVLFVKVPNGDYFRFRHALRSRLGLRWGAEPFGPPQRVAHYTLRTLRMLVEKAGLEVVESRSCDPVDSPVWWRITGLWLEIESPWYLGLPSRLARRLLHALGRAEELLSGVNQLSPAIYVLARRRASTSS